MGAERGQQFGSVVVGTGVGVGLAVASWFAIGPDHVVFAVAVQGGFLFMALLVGPVVVDFRRSRYRVRAVEPRLYSLLGADAVRRVLDVVGWNRVIRQMRQSESAQSGLARFLRGTEQSETAHCLGFVATVLLALIAVAADHLVGAVQVLALGVVLHSYPVMIQRLVRFRITRRR